MRELDYEKLGSDITEWIKTYVHNARALGVVLGLSGGIDSATTAALCAQAVGEDRVVTLGLHCHSLLADLEDARIVANHLGLKFLVIDLTSTHEQLLKALPPEIESTQMAIANVKPRLRMTTIYYVGQSLGGLLVAGTGNRAEIAVGYFTKYGDGGVDFEPLGDLYKCEVRALAKELNLPKKIIERPPSAGLWEGQTDEEEIGMCYDDLDEILYRMDHELALDDLDDGKVQKVKKMVRASYHKKHMPPIFRIDK